MPKKEPGPMAKTTKEIDVIKKHVDAAVKEANKTVSTKKLKTEERLNTLYKNCFNRKQELNELRNTVNDLTEEQEPEKVKNFENKKKNELKRLDTMITQMTQSMAKLLPEENEEEYARKVQEELEEAKRKAKAEEEEEDEEDEEDDEEDEEEEEEEEEETQKGAKKAEEDEEDEEEEEEDEDEEDEDEDEEEEEEEEEAAVKKTPQSPAKSGKQVTMKEEESEEEEEDEEDEEEEEEEDEEEDEEEEEEEEKKEEPKEASKAEKKGKKPKAEKDEVKTEEAPQQWITVDDYEGEESDLSFKKGEIITILETREDGWWVAENDQGEKGLVPRTYLQMYNKFQDAQQADAEEEDEEEEEEEEGVDTGRSSGKKLWGSIKKAITETTLSDVLQAMGAVPSGFRQSTLFRKHSEGNTYRTASYLAVKLSPSNLIYKDLFFDPATSKIRPHATRVERVVTIVSCQQIPPPSAGVEVLDRCVRICLFDGNTILSNIHSVRVSSVDKSQQNWSFTTKITDTMELATHAEFFVKTNNISDNIGILFELCITTLRTSTKEKAEMSCGWAHMPLLDENGTVIQNRSTDLYVNGGTPYEKGVEVDPRISRRTSSNAFVSLMSGNKQPRLMVRVALPKKEYKDQMDVLPDPLVGNTSLLPFYSYYRQILADVLLRDRLDLDSTERIHNPFLNLFPTVAEQMDMMKLLRTSWLDRLRNIRRVEKTRFLAGYNKARDEEYLKDQFRLTFMETVYPLQHIATLPAYRPGDFENAEARKEEVNKFREMKQQRQSALAVLLSSDIMFKPFNLDEVTYNIVGPHCLAKPVPASQS